MRLCSRSTALSTDLGFALTAPTRTITLLTCNPPHVYSSLHGCPDCGLHPLLPALLTALPAPRGLLTRAQARTARRREW